jgi:hypothetical protein
VLYGGGGGGAIHGFGWSGRRRWDSGVEKREEEKENRRV